MSADELVRRAAAGGSREAATAATGTTAVPALRTAVVTCMDTRIDVVRLFGLAPGEVHVLRNAGGVVTDDMLRSVAISQRKLGTREILLAQHTRCGMTTFTDEEFGEELAAEVGMRPSWRPLTFADVATNVARDLARLRRDPFLLPDTVARGFVLDVDTFALDEVAAPATVA